MSLQCRILPSVYCIMHYQRLKNIFDQKQYSILPVKSGQQLEIHEKVGTGDTQRIWKFTWLVINVKKPSHPDGTFTIRGTVAGVAIEKIYPLSFPKFEKVLLLDEYKTRRAKLYYMKEAVGKRSKLKSLLKQSERGTDILKK